jgi:hypothetical protein
MSNKTVSLVLGSGGARPSTRPTRSGHAQTERRRIVGVPDPKIRKADPQRESAFNLGSGGVICAVPTVRERIRLK